MRLKDADAEVVTRSACFSRCRNDEINKFKRFSRHLDQKPLLRQSKLLQPDHIVDVIRGRTAVAANRPAMVSSSRLQMHPPSPEPVNSVAIAAMASAMSSTDDVLGELVSRHLSGVEWNLVDKAEPVCLTESCRSWVFELHHFIR